MDEHHRRDDATYTLAATDEGNEVRVVVTATNPDASASAPSAASATVVGAPPVNTGVPVIGGNAALGTTLR